MRTNGILMHISSLSSPYGIGTLGKAAYEFVDFLHNGGQTYWQILPLCPTGFGDSPYMSVSSYAGNPYFIDLDILQSDRLLDERDYKTLDWGDDISKVDYGKIYQNRSRVLHIAAERFDISDRDFLDFCDKNDYWLNDYSLFAALKTQNEGKAFYEWDDGLRTRDKASLEAAYKSCKSEILYNKIVQYLFFKQWNALKAYANSKGIKIIGDIPIYIAADSADLWASPKQFELDENMRPKRVAGCPPDGFSEDGQLWGNPLYDWEYMQKDGFKWWISRVRHTMQMYDVVRIDHFRGFDTYWAVDANAKTAADGEWVIGPRMKLFDALSAALGELPIIAEDLGMLLPSVYELLEQTGFPGMKILQFAFDPDADSTYLPYKYDKNCVVYTGTHDNDTCMGWLNESGDRAAVEYAKMFMRLNDREGMVWGMIKTAMASPADTCIIPMQDIIGLGSEARMNKPSTSGGGNWCWRITPGCVNDWLAGIMLEITAVYHREASLKASEDEAETEETGTDTE